MSVGPVDIEFVLRGDVEAQLRRVSQIVSGESKALQDQVAKFGKVFGDSFDKSSASLSEMEQRLKALKSIYAELSDAGRKSEFGKIVNDQVKDLEKSIEKASVATENHRSSTGRLIDTAKGLLPAFSWAAIGAASVAALRKIISSTDSLSDAWDATMGAMRGATDYFFTTLATGDWSNFFTNLAEASRLGRDYARMLDELGDRQRAMSIQEANATQEALALEVKMRNQTLSREERLQAGEDRIKLEEDLARTREQNAQIALDNEINNNIKFKALSKEKTIKILTDLDSQERKEAELFNKKVDRLNELKELQRIQDSPQAQDTNLDFKIDPAEVRQLNEEIGKTPDTVKEYAQSLTEFGKVTDEEKDRVVKAYVDLKNAQNSAVENTKRLRTTVNALIAGEEKENEKNKNNRGKEKEELTGVLKLKKEIQDWNDKLIEASGEEQKAIAAKIVSLQKELQLKIELAEAAILAVRNTAVPEKMEPISVDVDKTFPVKVQASTLEVEKLKKKMDEAIKRADDLGKKFTPDQLKAFSAEVSNVLGVVNQLTQEYAAQLGLTEDQTRALEDSLQAVSGIADIAAGNYLQGIAKIADSLMSSLLKVPEAINVHFENLQKNIEKTLNSLQIVGQTLSNLGDSSVTRSIAVIESQLKTVGSEAKKLNDELKNKTYGPRRDFNTAVYKDIQQQVVNMENEINSLVDKLLRGQLSDAQRKAIEAVLNSYNSLLSQLDNITQEIIGTSVQTLSESIAEAFLAGEDAAEAWGDKVNDVIKYIMTKQLTAEYLTPYIKQATDQLVKDTEGGLTTDEALKFKQAIEAITTNVGPAFEAAREALKTIGIDMGASTTDTKGLTGTITGITEETGGMIAGNLMGIRFDLKEVTRQMLQASADMRQALAYQAEIATNTRHNARLVNIQEQLELMNITLRDKL